MGAINNNKLLSLEKLFQSFIDLEDMPGGILYLEMDPPWTKNTTGAILPDTYVDPSNYDPIEDRPAFARQHNLFEVLDIADIESIFRNAQAQLKFPTIEDLVIALNFYWDHDAFIKF